MKCLSRRQAVAGLLLCAAPVPGWVVPEGAIPSQLLIEPKALADRLASGPAPVILQVGFRALYDAAHIPGADYAGPGRSPEGIQRLRERVASLPHDKSLVIYCGCCPWVNCPNIAASYDTLKELGFSHLQVLHIPDSFATDWIDKGYPVKRKS